MVQAVWTHCTPTSASRGAACPPREFKVTENSGPNTALLCYSSDLASFDPALLVLMCTFRMSLALRSDRGEDRSLDAFGLNFHLQS